MVVQSPFEVLDVLRVQAFLSGVDAVVVIDDELTERAYEVAVTYEADDEAVIASAVRSWWSFDLERRPLTASDADQVSRVKRFVECDAGLYERLSEAHSAMCEDLSICDRAMP